MKKLFTFFVATMFAFSAFAAPFGITVNGTPVIGEENLMPMDPSYQEWYVFGQSLQVGDVVRLYDEGSGKEWAIDLDPAITVTITGGITEGFYTMGESGIFNFYLKLKQDADQLWIEKVGGVAPTPTTALAATNVTHNSFTANWVASNLEGATYSINVWNDDYDLIASASGLEETSYAVSNLDPESSYSYVVFVSVGEDESDASNSIAVTTLAKPAITPEQDEYQLFSDAGIEGSTSIIITAVNVAEATATITGDAEFYFKDFNDNPVTTKTFAVEPEGPTEIELYSMFTAGGDYSATITISATDADEVTIPVTAVVTKPTEKINVTATKWSYDADYYDVYVYSENTTYLFELTEDLEYGKNYTYANMVPTWTCTLTPMGSSDIAATDATLIVTQDQDGLVHIAATMVLNGDNHIIVYDQIFSPSTEFITPPVGLDFVKMPFTGSSVSGECADSVLVGWDNDIVYVQGLVEDFKTAWMKGVLNDGVVTFEKFQYVGMYGGSTPIWVLGTNTKADLIDFTMTYDAETNIFTATNILVVNASYEKIYYLDKVSNIVIGTIPPDYAYTEYENWQLKPEGSDWSDNLIKVEDGLFKMEIEWNGTGFNIKSDENPIKKDFFSVEELVIGEEVIAPVIVDIYLRVIDDETMAIGVGVDPAVSTDVINVINAEDVPNGAIIKDGKVYIIRDGKVYNLQGSEIKNADEILKSLNF